MVTKISCSITKLNSLTAIILLLQFFPVSLQADQSIADQYPGSMLYSKPIEVIPNVWTAIGATAPPTYENAGHNNNYTFIVTGEGVIVVNSGSYRLAESLHQEISTITSEPVVLVINENGQGHAMLGNGYWSDQGIPILAHVDAMETIKKDGHSSLAQLKRVTQEKSVRTRVELPTKSFSDKYEINLGKKRIEVLWLGHSHSSGDIILWLPEERLVVSGDMAFHERLLPIFEETDTHLWLDSWERFEALEALYVIPGHGHPTNMEQVRRFTRDYLIFLRSEVQKLLDEGGDLQAAYEIDQSEYARLHTFDELASRNAGRVFEQMEFE